MLPSIVNEVLKGVVAQYNAIELIVKREQVAVHPHPPRKRGTSLIRNNPLLGPYSRTIPRVLGWS